MTKETLLKTGYFIDNNYFNEYFKLILDNRNTAYTKFRTNRHHILPRHYFRERGIPIDNSEENTVVLTFRDHALAHLLLSGCTKGRDRYWNLYAIFQMSGHTLLPENLESLKEIAEMECYDTLYSEAIAEAPNHRKGVKVSNETRIRMSEAQKKRCEMYGNHNKGAVWVTNDEEECMVSREEADEMLQNGYRLGRKYRHSDETKNKIKEASSKIVRGEEFSEKMRKIALGHHHSEETKQKIREDHIGKFAGELNPFYGKKHSEEAKEKNRSAHVGKKAVHKDGKFKYILPEEIPTYLNEGWEIGNGIKRREINKCRTK